MRFGEFVCCSKLLLVSMLLSANTSRAETMGLQFESPGDGAGIVAGLQVIATNQTLSGPRSFAPGAAIEVAEGAVVVFDGDITAPPTAHIFRGGGSVRLPGQRSPVHPEWFGARADNTTDSAPAFQRAADALVGGGILQASSGQYKMGCETADALTLRGRAPVSLYGAGSQLTFLRPASNCPHTILTIQAENQSGNLRDFAITGDQLGVKDPAALVVDAIACLKCGVSDIQNLAITSVRNPIRLDYMLGSRLSNLSLQAYTGTGISVGGGPLNADGRQVASILHFEDIAAFPVQGYGYGMDFDSGASEIAVYRLVTAGGQEGIRIRNTARGGHFVEGIRFFAPNVDAFLKGNINIYEGHMIEFHNGSIGTTLIPGQPPNESASITLDGRRPDLVEGIWINDTTVRGAGGSGIAVLKACNVRLSGVMSYANGLAPNPTTPASGIDVKSACGTIDIVDAHAGLDAGGNTGWGNTLGRQSYGILLDKGITPRTYLAANRAFTTRIKITGCMCAGNLVRAIEDRSAVDPSWKLLANNMIH